MTVTVVSEDVEFRNAKDAFVGIHNDGMRGETDENSVAHEWDWL